MHAAPYLPTKGLLVSLLVATGGLVSCSPQTSAADPEAAAGGVKEREVPPVQVVALERREMVRILETTSKLESEGEIQVFPRLPGEVIEILAEEGDHVKAGDILARMDARDEVLAVRDAEVALRVAQDNLVLAELAVEEASAQSDRMARAARQMERDYERDKQLAEQTDVASPLSEQALEAKQLERDNARDDEKQAELVYRRRELEVASAKTAVARAEVALELANLNAEKKEIIAPFDGVIAERLCRLGDSAGTGMHAFVLTDRETLRAVFSRPQEELELFARSGEMNGKGHLSITATAESYPGRTFEGWVERISPTIDAASGQFRVTARLKPAEDGIRLLPGMLVRMEIITDRHPDALVVPKRALRREGERRYLLLVESGEDEEHTVSRVNVDEGYSNDVSVEIIPEEPGALEGGELVVFIGSRDLTPGDLVRIDDAVEDETPPEEIAEVELASDSEAQ